MTTLSTHPVEDPEQLALIADVWTPLARPLALRFREACRAEADATYGWVDPNKVRARLRAEDPWYNPRQLSALWSMSCGRDGFMVKTDRTVQITGEGSRGNGNKSVPLRRWVGWVAPAGRPDEIPVLVEGERGWR